MADSWTLFAQSAYHDWANMKFQKRKTPDGPGHRSKKEFEEYRRGVYAAHNLYKENAKLCLVVAKLLREGLLTDITLERAGIFDNTKKIITKNLSLLKP